MDYIIVQAGGKGTRLEYLTSNKPKALVPVENLPMLFHLFRKYEDKKFIIIADYKKEVLREYLECFAKVTYQVVEAKGTGTCSGIKQALKLIPDDKTFMLVWSDLILPKDLELPAEYEDDTITNRKDYVGISTTFRCRWSYKNGEFLEEPSVEQGVAGLFLFSEKSKLKDVPESGELVRWMKQQKMKYEEISLAGTKEFGILEEYNKLKVEKCRPFNRITVKDNKFVKEAIDEQGKKLAVRECKWYEKAKELEINTLPYIYSTQPLVMEYINGKNIYDCELNFQEKSVVLSKIVDTLKRLHNSSTIAADYFSIREAYYTKTMKRLNQIQDLVPMARQKTIVVNGKECRNVYYYKRELEKKIEEIRCEKFAFIHGDCTFSNIMLRESGTPVLIDPRGYFGYQELYGDARYDWAKLYYSIVGSYDRFNLKDFHLKYQDNEVLLQIMSNNWEDMEEEFFNLTGANPEEIKLLHAIIWLSLTTYAWQDYDSICGAFYNGLYYLEDVL